MTDYFYMIEEQVHPSGYYIVWDGIYETKEAAEAKIPSGVKARAQLYRTAASWERGPQRVPAVP